MSLPVVEVHVYQAAPDARWYLWVYGFSGKVRNTMSVSVGNFQITWIYIIGGQRLNPIMQQMLVHYTGKLTKKPIMRILYQLSESIECPTIYRTITLLYRSMKSIHSNHIRYWTPDKIKNSNCHPRKSTGILFFTQTRWSNGTVTICTTCKSILTWLAPVASKPSTAVAPEPKGKVHTRTTVCALVSSGALVNNWRERLKRGPI